MLFQDPIPNTSGYMIAGYAVAFIVLCVYVASLYIRNRNLQQDLAMLEEMDKPVIKTAPPKPGKKAVKAVTKKPGRK